MGALALTIGEVALFIGLMLVVGRRLFPWLLWQVARTGSRELFTLCVVAAALGIAYGSAVLFGVGLHFSLDDLLSVKKIALPGAVVQIAVATAMGMALTHWWGWSLMAGIVFGLALSVASTVVLLKALESRGVLATPNGRIAVGWLVVEDLVMVLVLVLLPPLARMADGGAAADQDGNLWGRSRSPSAKWRCSSD